MGHLGLSRFPFARLEGIDPVLSGVGWRDAYVIFPTVLYGMSARGIGIVSRTTAELAGHPDFLQDKATPGEE